MKTVFYSVAAIALILNFGATSEVQAIEEGLYWGGGSRYITISRKVTKQFGERHCYSGFSANGAMIASLNLKIPRYQTGIDYEVYTLDGVKNNLAIQQYAAKRDQIVFGALVGRFVRDGAVYTREANADKARSPELKECLNSNRPYFKQISSGRDRR
jgi:hypothetical protein